MQTFIISPYFSTTAAALDNKRLGKQRVEVLQLLQALTGKTTAYVNHPAAIMWKSNIPTLAAYGTIICQEWTDRGFKDTCKEKILQLVSEPTYCFDSYPWWMQDVRTMQAVFWTHMLSLVRKDFDCYYSLFNNLIGSHAIKNLAASSNYFWPRSDKTLWIITPKERRQVTEEEIDKAALLFTENYRSY